MNERTTDNTLTGGEEPNLDISSDLIRGHINTIILRTLYDGDKYGYDIINEIEKKSGGLYTLKQPTLYSSLKRLEAQGYVRPYWSEEATHGGRRKYFTLTDLGRQHVNQNLVELEYSQSVINQLVSDSQENDSGEPKIEAVQLKIEDEKAEEEFDIEIANEDAEKIVTVGDAVEQIRNALS